MNSTITKLLLSAVLSLGTIGTVSTLSNVIGGNEPMTSQEAQEVATNSTQGTVEKVVEDHDDYTVYTKTDDAIYEVEVDKWSGVIEEIDKEKSIKTVTSTTQKSQSSEITLEEAKAIALQRQNGTVVRTEVDDDDDYEIFIESGDYIYEIDVDRRTGAIDSVDKERIAKREVVKSTEITLEEAKTLALQRQNGTILETRTDDDDYEIFIQSGDYLYQIDVDRRNGRVDDVDRELLNPEVISRSEAESIALAQVNGTITSVDFDDDDLDYSVEIRKDNFEYEIEIDGLSGKVLHVEKDD